jgi:hypothetical protein
MVIFFRAYLYGLNVEAPLPYLQEEETINMQVLIGEMPGMVLPTP